MKHASGPYKHEMVPTPGADGQPSGYAVLIYPEAKVAAPEPGAEPVNMAVAVVTFFRDLDTTMANARLFEKAPELYEALCILLGASQGTDALDPNAPAWLVRLIAYIDNGEVPKHEEVQGSTGPSDGSATPGS